MKSETQLAPLRNALPAPQCVLHTARACSGHRRCAPAHSSQAGCSSHSSLGAQEAGKELSLSPGPHGHSSQGTSPARMLSDGLSKALATTDTQNKHINPRHCAKCLPHPTTPNCYSFLFKDMGTEGPHKKEAAHLAERQVEGRVAGGRQGGRWKGRAAGGRQGGRWKAGRQVEGRVAGGRAGRQVEGRVAGGRAGRQVGGQSGKLGRVTQTPGRTRP